MKTFMTFLEEKEANSLPVYCESEDDRTTEILSDPHQRQIRNEPQKKNPLISPEPKDKDLKRREIIVNDLSKNFASILSFLFTVKASLVKELPYFEKLERKLDFASDNLSKVQEILVLAEIDLKNNFKIRGFLSEVSPIITEMIYESEKAKKAISDLVIYFRMRSQDQQKLFLTKFKTKNPYQDLERSKTNNLRTLFVFSLKLNGFNSKMKELFEEYGEIPQLRYSV